MDTPTRASRLALVVAGLCLSVSLLATDGHTFDATDATARLDAVRRLAGGATASLGEDAETVASILGQANDCVTAIENELAPYRDVLDNLGGTEGGAANAGLTRELGLTPTGARGNGAGRPVDDSPQLRAIRDEATRLQGRLAECMLVSRRADRLLSDINALQGARLRSRLVARGTSLVETLRQGADGASLSAPDAIRRYLGAVEPLQARDGSAPLLWALAVAAVTVVGIWLRRRLHGWLDAGRDDEPWVERPLARELSRRAPWLGGLAVTALALPAVVAPGRAVDNMVAFALALTAWGVARSLIVAWATTRRQTDGRPEHPDGFRVLHALAVMVLGAGLLAATDIALYVPTSVYVVGRIVFLAALLVGVAKVVPLTRRAMGRGGRISLMLLIVLGVTLVAELLGFRALVDYVLGGLAGSTLALGVAWLVAVLLRSQLDELDEGRTWSRGLRHSIGVDEERSFPGTVWMRIVTTVAIWGGFGLALVLVWGLSETGFAVIRRYLLEGFEVGSFRIVPWQVLLAIGVFSLGLGLVQWLTDVMEKRWSARAPLDDSARHAVVKITSYVAHVAAALISLSVAGLTPTNLTLILGALSVGIGFGLRNIVNNFVSGLILLFERSIRNGDWIVVGETEGHVKRIRVRSTEIETFDRADVVVPNSELVSSQVTNWTLSDQYGRLLLDIGVAYDSDVEQVRDLLKQTVHSHDAVLGEQSERPPLVLFRGFGDSALRFQVHVFIEDINRRLQIESDLYVAAHRCLSEAGIEIPYPQRDLHLRTLPPGHTAIAGVEPDRQAAMESSSADERDAVPSS